MSISSFSLTKISPNSSSPSLSSHHQNWDECTRTRNVKIQSHKSRNVVLRFYTNLKSTRSFWRIHSVNGGVATAHGLSNSESYPDVPDGSEESTDRQEEKSLSTTKVGRILEQLKRYGVSGVLSYGLLNTAYYLTTFLLVWFYFAPSPGNMGYLAAASRFLQVMAMVWAGSQVTKLIRAAGAVALAPFVDRGLAWFTVRYKFQSRGKAFFTIVAFCLSLAVIVFLVVTLLWA